jgi:hypothetical protein
MTLGIFYQKSEDDDTKVVGFFKHGAEKDFQIEMGLMDCGDKCNIVGTASSERQARNSQSDLIY